MSLFVSPVAKETITKLQYLLQNTLYTYGEIVSSLSPESSNEIKEELSTVGLKYQSSEPGSKSESEIKDSLKDTRDDFINEKVERLGILNDQIQANVDLLPDSSFTRDDLLKHIQILDRESSLASDELQSLFSKFDSIYNTLKDSLDDSLDESLDE